MAKSYTTKQKINAKFFSKLNNSLLGKLDFELTERCNNNCVHCCINKPANDIVAKEKEISTNQIKEILTEAASLGCLSVRFTGGEPLLREDFEELYVFARKLGLKVLLFSNATLINPHLIRLFLRLPPLEKIEVTLYGIKKESYEAVSRVPGSFKAAWQGIQLLKANNIPFIVKGALLSANKDELEEFESFTSTIPWMDKPLRHAMFFHLHSRRDEKKNKLIKKNRCSAEEGLRVLARDKAWFFKNMREFCSKFIKPPGDKLFSCGAGVRGGCVDAYGNLQMCIPLRHPQTVYNLKNGSLKDALGNFFPKVRKMKAKNSDYLARCAKCFLKGLCEQCPGYSWAENGTLDAPVEYQCEIAHAQAIYLGLLNKGEKAWEISDWKERIRAFAA